MKKITFITSEFPPLPGGIGNHAFFLSKYFQKLGYEVTVITDYRELSQDIEFDKNLTFRIIRIKRNAFTYFNRILTAFKFSYTNDLTILSGKFSLWIGAMLKTFFLSKKNIAIIHGSELMAGGKISKLFTKWSLNKADKIIAVSTFTKSLVLQINPKLTVEVINNGIEIDNSINKGIKEYHSQDKLNLITIGNLTYRKGQQNVIKALPFLKNKFPLIHYHCVGIPTEIDSFTSLAANLKVLDSITFHGAVSNEKKINLLKEASVFCMLSSVLKNGDVEGFGIAVIEANAFGLPAIGSNDSGIADAISNHYSGVLINPTDGGQFYEALENILSNYVEYSGNAIKWANRFQWNEIIKKYEKVLNS